MRLHETRDWIDPLAVAASIPEDQTHWVLLHSGLNAGYTGQHSILALGKTQEIVGNDFHILEQATGANKDKSPFKNAWFGYVSYELRHALEKLQRTQPGQIIFSPLWMAQFNLIIHFNNKDKFIDIYGENESQLNISPACGRVGFLQFLQEIGQKSGEGIKKRKIPHPNPLPHAGEGTNITSNMTKQEYLEKVGIIKEALLRGDLYQANLTRKFFGEFKEKLSPFAIFQALNNISPAPYSAFIRMGDSYILSSSPERFISVGADGHVNSRPIKGSAPRSSDPAEDRKNREHLQNSAKDRAENLMIVDLMRNDISRNCISGSVKVDSLYDISTYATIHHMSSSISGTLQQGKTALDMIKGSFPPGSMTGTPKIQAMELCAELEGLNRGVYSGIIGWMGGDGSADFSVVIRTLIIQGNLFEFQVGGAIVVDSNPESEWEETIVKARGIAQALNIDENALRNL